MPGSEIAAFETAEPIAFSAASAEMAAGVTTALAAGVWDSAVWTTPARSLIADVSFARSLVTIVADSFAREMPT